MKKQSVCLTFIVVLLLLNTFSVSAITGSIGNARMILSKSLYPELENVDGTKTITIEKSILVKNLNDVPLNITLEADLDAEEFIEVIDSNFILQPAVNGVATEKKAVFEIKIRNEGTYQGKINVYFKPIDSDEPGVVLSSTIIVNAGEGVPEDNEGDNGDIDNGNNGFSLSKGIIFLSLTTLLLIIILIGLFYVMEKKKRKNEQKISKKEAKKDGDKKVEEKP